MRYTPTTALFAFVLLISFQAASQGGLHVTHLNFQELLENPMSGDEIVKESLRFDSIKTAEVTASILVEDTISGWKVWTTVGNHTFGKNRGDIPMITDVNSLHPYFRDKVLQLIAICKSKGIELAFVETYRTHAKQAEYKGMGKKYTRSGAGKSKHQYGLAVDVVPIVGDSAVWHNPVLWKKVGTVGERLGLRWGGRWRRPYDPGHFEWTGGLSTTDLAYGAKPLVPKKDQLYPCLEKDVEQLKKYWAAWEAEQSALTRK
ncbi:MAG TPA: M15 family metallopeptidase [Cyclobacteriaceae bacterium]